MEIIGIKAKKAMVAPGVSVSVAEIEFRSENGDVLYVSVHDYDRLNLGVSEASAYDYLFSNTEKPAEFKEEYMSWNRAIEKSEYKAVFETLRKVYDALG